MNTHTYALVTLISKYQSVHCDMCEILSKGDELDFCGFFCMD